MRGDDSWATTACSTEKTSVARGRRRVSHEGGDELQHHGVAVVDGVKDGGFVGDGRQLSGLEVVMSPWSQTVEMTFVF